MISSFKKSITLARSLSIPPGHFITWRLCVPFTSSTYATLFSKSGFNLSPSRKKTPMHTQDFLKAIHNNFGDPQGKIHAVSTLSSQPTSNYVTEEPMLLRTHNAFNNITRRDFSSRNYSQHGWKESGKNVPIKWLVIISGGLAVGILYKIFTTEEWPFGKGSLRGPNEEKMKAALKVVPKVPVASDDIPEYVPYLLIGGGPASFAASRAIKSIDPTAKVLIVTKEPYYPYMRPPLSKELIHNKNRDTARKLEFVQWNNVSRSVFYEPEEFYTPCKYLNGLEGGGISVAYGWEVTQLNPELKYAVLEDGKHIIYNKCLIATGSSPVNLPIFLESNQAVQEKVTTYRNLDDFFELDKIIERGAKSIAVIGGGFNGSELAFSLARRGLQVSLIYKEDGLLSKILPKYLSVWMTSKIEKEGISLFKNSEVENVELANKKLKIITNHQDVILADHAIVAVGAKPNTDLSTSAALEIDNSLGGYLVNAELEARKDLYIAGDCASFYDKQLGRRRVDHHDFALVTGRLAGENMTGAGKPFEYQPNFWSDFGPEMGYEALGVIDSSLRTVAVYLQNPPIENANILEELEGDTTECIKPMESRDFPRGVVFYLKDNKVVGILLWNIFGKTSIARQVLKGNVGIEDLKEAAKLFNPSDLSTE